MKCTSVFSKNVEAFNRKKRFIINQGGARSSKTYSVLQLLLQIAQRAVGNRLISVVSETMPHLRKGALRDFILILKEDDLYSEQIHNKTDNTFYIKSLCGKYESQIEFFSADSGDKVRGPQRDYLFINECNNINYETFYQLSMRTARTVFLDYNPVSSFWVHEELIPSLLIEDYAFIKSTYRDNEYLSENQKKDIERRALIDPNFKKVYADGEIGSLEGLIIQDWRIVDVMPETDKRRLGIDFGFTNDPTAILDIRQSDGGWWVDELCYQTGMFNNDIARVIKAINPPTWLKSICDSSDPKTIEDLKRMGIRAEGAVKGKDSIVNGIEFITSMPVNVTRRSTNFQKECRNYKWAVDRSGKSLNEPIDNWNHGVDAFRYGASDFKTNVPISSARYSF